MLFSFDFAVRSWDFNAILPKNERRLFDSKPPTSCPPSQPPKKLPISPDLSPNPSAPISAPPSASTAEQGQSAPQRWSGHWAPGQHRSPEHRLHEHSLDFTAPDCLPLCLVRQVHEEQLVEPAFSQHLWRQLGHVIRRRYNEHLRLLL